MKQISYIFTILLLISSCGNKKRNTDDSSQAKKDSIDAASKNPSTEKLPADWSDFYYCDNLDSALKYPDKVHHLDLRNYNIKKLPEEIIKLTKIEDIGFYWCYNFDWADVFIKLSKLRTLKQIDIADCCVRKLPKEISKLKQIRRFFCGRDSCLTSIPSEITQLDSLHELSIGGTFSIFPKQVLDLKNLKVLNFGCCGLKELPNNIDKLQNLDTLNVYGNKIKELPKTIINLRKLKVLNINSNPVERRSDYIDDLKAKMPNCKIIDFTTPLTFL